MMSPPPSEQVPHSTVLQDGRHSLALEQNGLPLTSTHFFCDDNTHVFPASPTLHTPPHPSLVPQPVQLGTHGVGVGPGGGGSHSRVLSLHVCPFGHSQSMNPPQRSVTALQLCMTTG